jgi:hypothetical protein
MTDQEVIPVGVGVCNAVRGVLTIDENQRTAVGGNDCYDYTQTENIKHFYYCILSECTV